jgi:hypothetical protein
MEVGRMRRYSEDVEKWTDMGSVAPDARLWGVRMRWKMGKGWGLTRRTLCCSLLGGLLV